MSEITQQTKPNRTLVSASKEGNRAASQLAGLAASLQIFAGRVNVKLVEIRSTDRLPGRQHSSRRTAFQFIIQNDRFCDFLHGLPPLLAFALERSVGLFLIDFELALQDAFGALDDFPAFQLT